MTNQSFNIMNISMVLFQFKKIENPFYISQLKLIMCLIITKSLSIYKSPSHLFLMVPNFLIIKLLVCKSPSYSFLRVPISSYSCQA